MLVGFLMFWSCIAATLPLGCPTRAVFVELKSRRGVASEAQIKLREEMLPVGVKSWMARSARAAMAALQLSGVTFRRKWPSPQLQPWEGPFADPTQRLPKHPKVAVEWRVAKRRYRLRRKLREREATLAGGGATIRN
jgi:hypothetical protein